MQCARLSYIDCGDPVLSLEVLAVTCLHDQQAGIHLTALYFIFSNFVILSWLVNFLFFLKAIVVTQNKLYSFGGCRQNPDDESFSFNSELHCLDLESMRWSLLYDDPQERSRVMYKHGLALYDNKLYVIGSSYRDLNYQTHQEKVCIVCGKTPIICLHKHVIKSPHVLLNIM